MDDEISSIPDQGGGPDPMTGEMVALHRDMLRFARLQLRDGAAAEDAVQEAIAGALAGRRSFENRSQFTAWVFAILRNKIIDIVRDRARMPGLGAPLDRVVDDACEGLFNKNGSWRPRARPAAWGDPERSFSSPQFWAVFETCLNRLPENTARIFMMREMLELETREICKELNLSATDCRVALHGARMGLRACLDERWFKAEKENA